ncbi:MAG: HisA/HisF-related TIM barrel protein [Pseudomonadota bacterium]
MMIIPVIDVLDGQVVRAVAGDRDHYGPLETQLVPGTCEPLPIARALLDVVPNATTLYVADLNGLMGRGPQVQLLLDLARGLPGVQLMLDDGVRSLLDAERWRQHDRITQIIGTETLAASCSLADIAARCAGSFVLSLDHRGAQRLGCSSAFEDVEVWPDTVIVMDVKEVGGRAGPDLKRLAQIKALAGKRRRVLAAGGVRISDLASIDALGCGALMSTALHRLTKRNALQHFQDVG